MAEKDKKGKLGFRNQLSAASRASIAGRLAQPVGQANQRNQASAGSLGSTTGDSSGTGANSGVSQLQQAAVAQPFSPKVDPIGKIGDAYRSNPATIARGLLDKLDSEARLGNISVKNAVNAANNILGTLTSSQDSRYRTDIGAQTSSQDRAVNAAKALSERSSSFNELMAKLGAEKSLQGERLGAASAENALDREQSVLDRLLRESEAKATADYRAKDLGMRERQMDQQTKQFLATLGLDEKRFTETVRSNKSKEGISRSGQELDKQAQALRELMYELSTNEDFRKTIASMQSVGESYADKGLQERLLTGLMTRLGFTNPDEQ